MMLVIYKLFSYIMYFCFFVFGRFSAEDERQLWRGRLGLIDSIGPTHMWIHAASVGEIRIVGYLVDYLLKQQPRLKIHVTTMTSAGYRTAVAQMGDAVTLTYFPLDAPPAIRRTLNKIAPELVVVAETEIWPNLICETTRRMIPMVQVNGRMSPRAFNRYRLVHSMIARLVNNYRHWFIKTDQDAERYSDLGLRQGIMSVVGDMKFDAPVLRQSDTQQGETRSRAGLSSEDFILVAGSTRSGEERMLTEVYAQLSSRHDSFRLILAPRHVERMNEITEELDKANIQWCLFDSDEVDHSTSLKPGLILVDTLGQLNDIYQIADLAFVGGTMVPIGGHNLLEPVWAQTPVLFGPHTDNVREAAAYIMRHGFGMQVDGVNQLTNVVEEVYLGHREFAVKQIAEMSGSTTAQIGTYLLEMCRDA